MIFRVVAAASLLFCSLIKITAALSFGQHRDEQGQQFPIVMRLDHNYHQLALNPSDRIREA